MDKNINSDFICFKAVSAANLKNFSLTLKKQAINYILGPNASGKTILTHHLVYKSSLQQILPALGEIEIVLPFSTLNLEYQEATGIIPAVDLLCLAETLSPAKSIAEFLGIDKILAKTALDFQQPKCDRLDCGLKPAQAINVVKDLKKEGISKILITVALEKNKSLETKISKLIKLGFSRFIVKNQLIKVQETQDEISLFLKIEKEKEVYAVLSQIDCQEKPQQELIQDFNESLEITYGIGEELLVIFIVNDQGINQEQKRYCKNAFYCPTCQKTLAFSELRTLSNVKKKKESYFDLYLEERSLTELLQMKIGQLELLSNPSLAQCLNLLIKFGFKEHCLSQHLSELNVAEKIKLLCIYYYLSQFSDILFILDCPSRYLNIAEQKLLLEWAEDLVKNGNTLLFSEISPPLLEIADNLIYLAPWREEKININIKKILSSDFHLEKFLQKSAGTLLQIQADRLREANEIVSALETNYQLLKKTKKLKSLAPNLLYLKVLNYNAEKELYQKKISFQSILEFSGLLNPIAKLYASLASAKKEGLTEKDFISENGREKCNFIKWNNLNVNDLFNLNISAAKELFQSREDLANLFDQLILLGFSELSLSRKFCELSYSEIQLLRVFREFSNNNSKHTLFVLEQVFSGLDSVFQKRCYQFLQLKLKEVFAIFLIQT